MERGGKKEVEACSAFVAQLFRKEYCRNCFRTELEHCKVPTNNVSDLRETHLDDSSLLSQSADSLEARPECEQILKEKDDEKVNRRRIERAEAMAEGVRMLADSLKEKCENLEKEKLEMKKNHETEICNVKQQVSFFQFIYSFTLIRIKQFRLVGEKKKKSFIYKSILIYSL